MQWLLDLLERQSVVIREAFPAFALVCLLAIVVLYLLFERIYDRRYKERIESYKDLVESLKERLAHYEKTRKEDPGNRNKATNGKAKAWSAESQKELSEKLRPYANEYSTVHLSVANHKHIPLAELLKSIFKLAGWQTNMNTSPLELQHNQYFEGVTVKGFNKHLVEAVAKHLTEAGVSGVKPIVATHNLPSKNPKVIWAEHKLEIMIGHTD